MQKFRIREKETKGNPSFDLIELKLLRYQTFFKIRRFKKNKMEMTGIEPVSFICKTKALPNKRHPLN